MSLELVHYSVLNIAVSNTSHSEKITVKSLKLQCNQSEDNDKKYSDRLAQVKKGFQVMDVTTRDFQTQTELVWEGLIK